MISLQQLVLELHFLNKEMSYDDIYRKADNALYDVKKSWS
mgnify:CR=1 FL=1